MLNFTLFCISLNISICTSLSVFKLFYTSPQETYFVSTFLSFFYIYLPLYKVQVPNLLYYNGFITEKG